MALELKQEPRLQLGLRVTLQLQQAIKLLQLNRLELQDAISHEMMENPLLEGDQEMSVTDPVAEPAATDDTGADVPAQAQDETVQVDRTLSGPEGDFAWGKYLDGYIGSKSEGAFGRPDSEESTREDKRLKTRTSLEEHLFWQLRLADGFDDQDTAVGVFIIGNLDNDGMLTADGPDDDLVGAAAKAAGVDWERAERVLKRIQLFDPVGIASRDIRECLLVQAEQFSPGNSLITDILRNYYDDFRNMRFASLAKVFHTDEDVIMEAIKVISKFETRPGRNYTSEEPRYITPDLYIEKVGGEYKVILNEDGMPRLRISRFYRQHLLGNGKDEASKYIKEKMNSAKWFINSVEHRQRTIYKVAETIVKLQKDFFDRGSDYLKPMCLKDVAQEIGVHESTVGRVTTSKYVHTPQGIFELKYFFSSSLDAAGGMDVASRAVKSMISKILSDEGTRSKSDNEIAVLLARDGIKIARRTVAKYRMQMGIVTQVKRKKML